MPNTQPLSDESNKHNDEFTLLQGDCVSLLEEFVSNVIPLVVTSPPYDNLRSYDSTLSRWDECYWQQVIQQLYRIIAPGGVVVWVVGDATVKGSETGTSFKQALFAKACGFSLHDTMIYHKEGPPLSHNRYEQKFEYMFVWSKGKPRVFSGIQEDSLYAGQSRATTTQRQDSEKLGKRCGKGTVKKKKLKGNIWKYNVGNGSQPDGRTAFQHPAVFPYQLAADHVYTWSKIGDTVLDPFCGSGTTGLASLQLGRRFIGIERNEEYLKLAESRLRHRRR